MERLTGLDATFVHAQTSVIHMHTLKVAIVDALPGLGENTFERFRDEFAARLHLLPPFRRRIVQVPFGFHHPVWIEDPNFDLDFHLRRVAVPAPGGREEMDALVADIASHPLDHRHPLWEIWRLEGLADGGVAYVAKIHHALADGIAAAHMLANVMSAEPETARPPAADDAWQPEPMPTKTRLLTDAFVDHLRKLVELMPLIARTLAGFWRVVRHRLAGGVRPSMPFDGPKTALNRRLTAARSFATTDLSLEELRTMKSALGVTMNDVVLTIVGGALKQFLEERGDSVRGSLIAAVPVATSGADDPRRLAGNRLSNLFASLCTDIDDPVDRAHAIHEKMEVAKAAHQRLGPSIMQDWVEYLPPRPYAWITRTYSRLGLSTYHRPAANVIVSNVRGPAEHLYVSATELRSLYSVGPIVEGIGVNVTAWSCADKVSFAVIAGRETIPDAHALTACLHRAAADLGAAARRPQISDPPRTAAR